MTDIIGVVLAVAGLARPVVRRVAMANATG